MAVAEQIEMALEQRRVPLGIGTRIGGIAGLLQLEQVLLQERIERACSG